MNVLSFIIVHSTSCFDVIQSALAVTMQYVIRIWFQYQKTHNIHPIKFKILSLNIFSWLYRSILSLFFIWRNIQLNSGQISRYIFYSGWFLCKTWAWNMEMQFDDVTQPEWTNEKMSYGWNLNCIWQQRTWYNNNNINQMFGILRCLKQECFLFRLFDGCVSK